MTDTMHFVIEARNVGDKTADEINDRLAGDRDGLTRPVEVQSGDMRGDGVYRVYLVAGRPGECAGDDALGWVAEAAGVDRDDLELVKSEARADKTG